MSAPPVSGAGCGAEFVQTNFGLVVPSARAVACSVPMAEQALTYCGSHASSVLTAPTKPQAYAGAD
ncbi:MAG: hypothetical protein RMJ55_06730 [Roseiflexaceae bacterium]|nr:hypothetical protein [Roseiflexaceae bacterium]